MIIVLEPVCSSWIHEDANAGFLQLVRKNCKDRVVFIAEKEHIYCVRKICHIDDVEFVRIGSTVPKKDADDFKHLLYYFRLLMLVICKYRPKKLFVLCAYRPCLLAAEMCALFNHNVEVNIVIHSMIEKYKGNQDAYRCIFCLSQFFNKLRFITYSPYCTGNYWRIDEKKFIFMDLNYVDAEKKKVKKKGEEKIVIGIIGACANEKAKKIILFINRHQLTKPYEFWVISNNGKMFRYIDNVKVLDLNFDRKRKQVLLQQLNYILLPYDQEEYALSASGVLWDAILHKIPCFMLGSDYLKYYMKYNIGYQADNIKNLCKIIIDKIQNIEDESQMFFVGLDQMMQKRDETMKFLLRE